MSMRKIAFWVGLFSTVVGLFTYDSEVSTALMPIITGLAVMVLAIFNLIPEFTNCPACRKKTLKTKPCCRHCGADLKENAE